jgi:hypothetical protein
VGTVLPDRMYSILIIERVTHQDCNSLIDYNTIAIHYSGTVGEIFEIQFFTYISPARRLLKAFVEKIIFLSVLASV